MFVIPKNFREKPLIRYKKFSCFFNKYFNNNFILYYDNHIRKRITLYTYILISQLIWWIKGVLINRSFQLSLQPLPVIVTVNRGSIVRCLDCQHVKRFNNLTSINMSIKKIVIIVVCDNEWYFETILFKIFNKTHNGYYWPFHTSLNSIL